MPSKNISPRLALLVQETIQNNEQVFLLYNRRGFASYLQCESCQTSISCPNCSVTLTFHRSRNQLLCHYCNLSLVPPSLCPSCPKEKQLKEPSKLVLRGAGTEKIFEELQELFPQATIARLDRDTVTDEAAYRKLLDEVRAGQIQILVGTQMIAKGHDLPGVTLVGVVDCDVGLHMPDFRAGERVFQLLTQAAGRAGRGDKAGRVVLQTRVPSHPSVSLTHSQDFAAFASQELLNRELHSYPPYARLLRIVCSSADHELAENQAKQIKRDILDISGPYGLEVKVLGPTPAPIAKIKTLWRWHLLVKAKSAAHLNRIIRELAPQRSQSKKVRIVFDMDPQDLM
jgi:primosomal protein N' (replication factor Y)